MNSLSHLKKKKHKTNVSMFLHSSFSFSIINIKKAAMTCLSVNLSIRSCLLCFPLSSLAHFRLLLSRSSVSMWNFFSFFSVTRQKTPQVAEKTRDSEGEERGRESNPVRH